MPTKARVFIEFWTENSIHAREPAGVAGAEQNVEELVRRLTQAALAEQVSEEDMRAEVGDLTNYLRRKLAEANRAEKVRNK